MAKYYASEQLAGSQQALSTSYKSLVIFTANSSGTIRRGKIYDVTVGANGSYASTDTEVEYQLIRQTAAGTASAATASPLDPADAAFSGLCTVNATAESGSLGVELFHISANQRATYRWVAAPGSELLYPATASNGITTRAKGETSGYTGTASASVLIDEQ